MHPQIRHDREPCQDPQAETCFPPRRDRQQDCGDGIAAPHRPPVEGFAEPCNTEDGIAWPDYVANLKGANRAAYGIERIQLVKVTMPANGWTWPSVSRASPVILA